jgi:3-hydroxyisobutyrate dehydrogenase-like beta-hydroxyacid dehydrogenase
MASTTRLGWIGLGSMGLAMALNLQNHINKSGGHPLRYTNRTISRGAPLEAIGGVPSTSVAEVVQNCDIIFISVRGFEYNCSAPMLLFQSKTNISIQVSDDAVLNQIMQEIISSGPLSNKTIIDTTTIHPNTSTAIDATLHSHSASYIAAPVFGATPTAEAGQLIMALAGPNAAIASVTPYLEGVLARKAIRVSTDPAKALLLKTTSNFITAGTMYLISEAHVLAEKSGLDTDVLESLIEANFGAYAHSVSRRMTQGVYYPAKGEAPFSGLELGMKDVGHGLGVAREAGMELRVAELVMGCMEEAKRVGEERGRRMDSSSVYGVVRQRAGLEFENGFVKERDAEKRG